MTLDTFPKMLAVVHHINVIFSSLCAQNCTFKMSNMLKYDNKLSRMDMLKLDH